MVSKMASMKVAWMVETKVALWEGLMVDGMVVIAVEKLAVQLVASTVSRSAASMVEAKVGMMVALMVLKLVAM